MRGSRSVAFFFIKNLSFFRLYFLWAYTLVCKKIHKKKTPHEIAEELDEDDVNHIQEIYDIALKYAPDYDPEKIYKELVKEKKLVNN